jgi:hypothetical protein
MNILFLNLEAGISCILDVLFFKWNGFGLLALLQRFPTADMSCILRVQTF